MPGKIKVKILAGRNLPVMDRSGDTTDAYVELKFGNITYKTDVCRKSLNPQWNSEWYKFEVDDAELQDEPLQIRLMDHDTYSANDAIGKVYINLNPLLLPGMLPPVKNIWTLEAAMNTSAGSQGSVMTGWIPVYDTMHGIRGEVNIIIKVELFSDFNKFRQSSCGVLFFYSPNIPYGYHAQMIHGFVEELVVSDDPEYQWIDKIRTPRASNEARQTLFFKLSGEVQRKIGLKALDLGGNAVIGYLQNFDLEGESGIVARGIGTAVTLVKLHDVLGFPCDSVNIEESAALALPPRTKTEPPDDSALLLFTPVPASYPLRIPTRLADRTRLPFSHAKSSCSLTRLETPGHATHKRPRIPFFRSNTSSTLSLRTFGAPEPTTPECLIDETVKSLRTMLAPPEDSTRRQSPNNRLSRQIRSLRDKFDPVGEENCLADPVRSFIVSVRNPTPREPRSLKETKAGKVMAALLIGSIQTMPLVKIGESIVASSNEQPRDEESKFCCEEEAGDVKTQLEQDASSSTGETEASSFDEEDSPDDDSSEDNTSYNILHDSRYSLDGSDGAGRSPSTHRRNGTRSTLQVDSDVPGGTGRPDEIIPIITVDVHESCSDVDACRLLPSDEDASPDGSRDPTDTDGPLSSVDQPRDVQDASAKSSLRVEEDEQRGSSQEKTHRVHLTRHQRDLCRARSLPTQAERRSARPGESPSLDEKKDAPRRTTDAASPRHGERRSRLTSERQRCMLDLIRLIDTKMMAERASTRRVKRAVSLRSRRRRRERSSPSRASTRRRHQERDASFRVPRVSSTPDCLSSGHRPVPSSRPRSCGSSLPSLADCRRHRRHHHHHHRRHHNPPNHTRTPAGSSRADDASEISKRPLESRSDVSPNAASEPTASRDAVAIRKCSSVCNLGETLCHIDHTEPTNTANMTYNSCVSRPFPDLRQQDQEAASSISPSYPLPAVPSVAAKVSQSPASRTLASVPLHRRSSDSDLSVTPKGNSLGNNDRSMAAPLRTPAAVVRSMNQDTLEMLEYPFITMQHYPPGFILHIGGLVSSRSVKLLERISNLEEPEGRDAWWTEIRMEVRSHARALACNVVIGYKEETSICDDVCVLSASGTAAVINLHNSAQEPDGVGMNKLQLGTAASVDSDREKGQLKPAATKTEKADGETPVANHSERQSGKACRHSSENNDHEGPCGQAQLRCNLCHLPYSEKSVPFRVNVSKCAVCKRARVPDVMFTTIEVPANIPTTGRGCFIQATVCKNKKDLRGELNAKEISDCLPFLEYELHSLLLNKLRMKGMNAIFGLRLQVSVGERLIIGMAVGTALYLTALPPPIVPKIASGNSWHNDEQLAEIQKSIVETVKKNREFYHLKPTGEAESARITSTSDTDESDEDLPELDLGMGTRDTCVLEVDDIEDLDRISSLMDDRPPDDFHVVNTQTIPGLEDLEIVRNLQMFTQVSRTKIPAGQSATMPSKFFARLLQSLCFKLRRMVPCALCDMQFRVALPEQDEIQVTVVGMALGLGEPLRTDRYKKKIVCRSLSKDQVRKSDDSDMIFSLDEDHVDNNVASDNAVRTCVGSFAVSNSVSMQKPRPRSPLRSKTFATHRHKHVPLKGRYGVDITPLSYLPGGRIERYQGNLNFFFIRESTSIRENGGLSGFTHSFVMEVLAIVRAHITALGGNAMVAFSMTQCVLLHSPHKNQGQCLINVGGDVVTVSYYADEKHSAVSNC
ncbi:PREDICTED: C2 domain-containing protein 5 isoform X1 [Dinoponera quadriceps]|uniref:C2 domain-containing protein 5 isoform X1 n=1 Tax=Dinoponera quadriceps TaxID=609295 RepID=A0A6P3WVL1_DINQU|nr:PREDICTED: C2 domain-containing protein 5 isoform X1 [Dinoponera quadriceps]